MAVMASQQIPNCNPFPPSPCCRIRLDHRLMHVAVAAAHDTFSRPLSSCSRGIGRGTTLVFVCARPPQRCSVRISSISGHSKKVQTDLILSMILD